jgi:PAS domain S-box-containing protein
MAGLRSTLSIRLQLLGLFGLLLLTTTALLVLDEWERQRSQAAITALKDRSLTLLRRVKAVSDAYGLDVVDTTFRVRNYLIDWDEGVVVLDNAAIRIDQHWRAIASEVREPHQREVVQAIVSSRQRADIAARELREILQRRDIAALGRFADTELYPAVDPVTTRLKYLSDLILIEAERDVLAESERSRRAALGRIALLAAMLAVMVWVGQRILRNIYRGVESLGALTRQMQKHDFESEPSYRPRGELGRVQQGLLEMREAVRNYEAELTGQLRRIERVRAALQESERFQRAILSAAQVAVMSVDLQGRFTGFNPFAERLLGYRLHELNDTSAMLRLLQREELDQVTAEFSRSLDDVVHPDVGLLALLASRRDSAREWTLVRKDGARVPVLLSVSAILDEDGRPSGYLGVATDLTQIKQLERQLRASEAQARQATEAKSAFLAAMSHEIRTPMIGVTGMLEILNHTSLNDEQRRTIQVVQQSASSLLQIIGDILDFSKIEAGRLELAEETFSLGELLPAIAENFGAAASAKGLVLTCTVDPRVSPAHRGDALRIRQILSNFLSNAIKFTDKGFIELVLEWQGRDDGHERLSFRVTDTGIGIGAEQQARLFAPFQQAEADTTRRYGGTGLGLAIARRLAELMRGEVTLESERGHGTTLRLNLRLPIGDPARIPAQAPNQGFVPRKAPGAEEARALGRLVLVVDDHATNRLVVSRQLALAGFASETAEDGIIAFERWRSGRYGLVLTDLHMPEMDGYQLARAIREREARDGLRRTPVVALTAAALKGEAERCRAAGMDDYLTKPVSIPQLASCLQRWLPDEATPPSPDAPAAAGASESAAADAAVPVLDDAMLLPLTGGSAVETRALLVDFLLSCDGDFAAVESAWAARDFPRLRSEAHKIKGAARSVGAQALAVAAERVEAAASRPDIGERGGALIEALDAALAQLSNYTAQRFGR